MRRPRERIITLSEALDLDIKSRLGEMREREREATVCSELITHPIFDRLQRILA